MVRRKMRKKRKTVKSLPILMKKTLIHLDQGLRVKKMTPGPEREQVVHWVFLSLQQFSKTFFHSDSRKKEVGQS